MVKLAKWTRRSVNWFTLGLPPVVGRGASFTINSDQKDLALPGEAIKEAMTTKRLKLLISSLMGCGGGSA